MAELSDNNVGKIVEWDGKIFGLVVFEDTKKLLVRTEAITNNGCIYFGNKAVFINKQALIKAYWIKLHNTNQKVIEMDGATDLTPSSFNSVNFNH